MYKKIKQLTAIKPDKFLDAVSKNNEKIVKNYLAENQHRIEAIQEILTQALRLAAANGFLFIVKELLRISELDIDAEDLNGNTALMLAAQHGHLYLVKTLKNHGAWIDHKNQYGNTALMRAAQLGHLFLVKALKNQGARIDHKNAKGLTARGIAIQKNHRDIVRFLEELELIQAVTEGDLEAVNDLIHHAENFKEITDSYGNNALMLAIHNRQPAVFQAIMNADIMDINRTNHMGYSALICAIINGDKGMVKVLLSKKMNLDIADKNKNTALLWAISQGQVDIAKILIEKGANWRHKNGHQQTALDIARSKGYTELIYLLQSYQFQEAERYADLNIIQEYLVSTDPAMKKTLDQHKNHAFMEAVRRGHLAVVNALLTDPGIDFNAFDSQGDCPLALAIYHNHLELVKRLLKIPGINLNALNSNKDTALTLAARNGHIEVVKLLLTLPNLDVNAVDSNGHTALFWAAANGHTEIVNTLIAVPGNAIDHPSRTGETPLMMADKKNHYWIQEMLLNKGANPFFEDGNISRPSYHRITTARTLQLASKGDLHNLSSIEDIEVHTKDQEGNTPLMLAARHGHTDCVKFLMDKDWDVSKRNLAGKTAQELAREQGYHEIAELLLKEEYLQAAGHGDLATIEKYIQIKNKAPEAINIVDKYGNTALMLAVQYKQMESLKALIAAGVDVNAQQGGALRTAAKRSRSVLKTLLEVPGIDVNIQDSDGMTPMHHMLSGYFGFEETKLLLDHGADPTIMDKHHRTPLQMAKRNDSFANKAGVTKYSLMVLIKACVKAIEKGQLKTLQDLLAEYQSAVRAYLTLKHSFAAWDYLYGGEIFITAVLHKNIPIIKYLIQQNINLDVNTLDGMTALDYAFLDGDLAIIHTLLQRPIIHFSNTTPPGGTPLMWAARRGQLDIVKILITKGAPIAQKDSSGDTAADIARKHNHQNIAAFLEKLQFIHAVNTGDLPYIKKYIQEYSKEINSDSLGHEALIQAAHEGHIEIVKALLDVSGIDVNTVLQNPQSEFNFPQNASGNTPLMMAAFAGHLEVVQMLLHQGADVLIKNKSNRTAAQLARERGKERVAQLIECIHAARSGDLDYIQKLLQNIPKREYFFIEAAITEAVKNENWSVVSLLIKDVEEPSYLHTMEQDPRVNKNPIILGLVQKNLSKLEFIEAAAKNDSHHLAFLKKYLLSHQDNYAAINAVNRFGNSALIVAAAHGNLPAVQALYHCGADLTLKNYRGNTAEQEAWHLEVIQFLQCMAFLQAVKTEDLNRVKASLKTHKNNPSVFNVCDKDGATVLALAARTGSLSLVRTLIYGGLDIHYQNQVDIAAQEAARLGHQPIADLLAASSEILLRRQNITGLSYEQRLEAINRSGAIPEIICPISLNVMTDPITTVNNQTFDRSSLKELFNSQGNPPSIPCPLTRLPLKRSILTQPTNRVKQNEIQEIIEAEEEAYEIKRVAQNKAAALEMKAQDVALKGNPAEQQSKPLDVMGDAKPDDQPLPLLTGEQESSELKHSTTKVRLKRMQFFNRNTTKTLNEYKELRLP